MTDDDVIEQIQSSRTYEVGTYQYFVWPYKGFTEFPPQALSHLASRLAPLVPKSTQALLSFMTDGSLLVVPVARQIKKPFIVCRDHHYDLPEAELVKFRQRTKYFSRLLYFARPMQGRRICIFDAIISSGQTVIAAGHALRKAGCEISGVVTALAKVDYGGVEKIQAELGIMPQVLYNLYHLPKGGLKVERAGQ